MSSSRIGQRIVMSTQGDRWMATVSSDIPAWQRQSLELWFGAWVALGAMLGYGVISPSQDQSAHSTSSAWGFGPFSPFAPTAPCAGDVRGWKSSNSALTASNCATTMAPNAAGPACMPSKTSNPPAFPNPTLVRSSSPWNSSSGWSVATASMLPSKGKPTSSENNWNLHEAQQLAKVFNQRLAKLQKKHSTPGD